MKRTIEGKRTIETIETERLTRLTLGNQTNARHVVNAASDVKVANSAPFGIENVMPPTGISVSSVNISPCSSLTWHNSGPSKSNTTS